jgi:hypothetical protein
MILLKSFFIKFILCFFLVWILLTSVEGCLSFYHLYRNITHNNSEILDESPRTQYDPLLGWVNKKNVFILDLYGSGIDFTSDANGFRKTPVNPNPNSFKVICTGDSFTMGHGVGDNENWCSLISRGNLQSFNMGQTAYGIDQSYLWYQRDAAKIPHTFHIMAFILDDFNRVALKKFYGYDKPFFQIKNNILTNINYPVPQVPKWFSFIRSNQKFFESLNIYMTSRHIKDILVKNIKIPTDDKVDNQNSEKVISAILDNLVLLTKQRKAIPVFVLLPTNIIPEEKDSYMKKYNERKEILKKLAIENGGIFIDIGKSMFNVGADKFDSYFLPDFLPRDKHYTKSGHMLVAQNISSMINQYITKHPELMGK